MSQSVPPQLNVQFTIEETRHLLTLMQGIPPRSSARRLAEQILTSPEHRLPPLALQELCTVVLGQRQHTWKERRLAVCCMAYTDLPPEQRPGLVRFLAQVAANKPPFPFFRMRFTVVLLYFLFWCAVLQLDGAAVAFFTYPFFHYILYISAKRNWALVRAECVRTLQTLGAVEALDEIVPLIMTEKGPLRNMARSSLFTLLPLLTPAHYGRLQSRTLYVLAILLTSNPSQRLALLILEALGKVGNAQVLPYIKRVARRASSSSLVQAAREAQSQIEERLQRDQQSRTLLRASQQEPTRPEHLLRAVALPNMAPPPCELLRPGEKAPLAPTELTMAILEDIKQRKDERAIPVLEQLLLASTLPTTLRAVAQDCLSTLKATQELNRYAPPTPPLENPQQTSACS